ncbi:MAG: hypothetical protein MRZ79_12765 [Bacteroidia bacterium]|nr:hypothetical protein [Bacteroidia bacterium]
MNVQELQAKVLATKQFLDKEIVRNKRGETSFLSFREIGDRMDMIHEAERVGVRNLGERQNRKLTRMIRQLEDMTNVSMN